MNYIKSKQLACLRKNELLLEATKQAETIEKYESLLREGLGINIALEDELAGLRLTHESSLMFLTHLVESIMAWMDVDQYEIDKDEAFSLYQNYSLKFRHSDEDTNAVILSLIKRDQPLESKIEI